MIKDTQNNVLEEGDIILFAMGLGQYVPAVIEKIESGLLAPGQQQAQPQVHIRLQVSLPILAGGLVPGVIFADRPEKGGRG